MPEGVDWIEYRRSEVTTKKHTGHFCCVCGGRHLLLYIIIEESLNFGIEFLI
jgi:hypothetical protein